MNFIFIFGPQAVGKMTVGQELAKKTGYKLLYNHLTIDIAKALYDTSDIRFIKHLNRLNLFMFSEFIKNPSADGLIYTDVWLFNRNYDVYNKVKMLEMFERNGWNVYLVELMASIETRLMRNGSENRLNFKPSKRDCEASSALLKRSEQNHILNSNKATGFYMPAFIKKHIKIETEDLCAELSSFKIILEFGL